MDTQSGSGRNALVQLFAEEALLRAFDTSLMLLSQAEFPVLYMTEEPASDLPGVGIDRNRHLDH